MRLTDDLDPDAPPPRWPRLAAGALAWAAGWAALLALDGRFDLHNLAILLVCTATVATLWLPPWLAAAAGGAGVLAFNWRFVPPRGSFDVDLQQHALLLGGMVLLNLLVAGLMAARQRQAEQARALAGQAQALRRWGDLLRDEAEPALHAGELQQMLARLTGGPALLWLQAEAPGAGPLCLGEADAEAAAALAHCLRQGQAMGPGTGRHQELPAWLLPLRGRGRCLGAAHLSGPAVQRADDEARAHAQALCDQLGLALQRHQAARDEAEARAQAQTQGVRNALLAAISHDYRTPLATILGAASSLESQDERLDSAQRRRLARLIMDETGQLARLTDNTLQLARLDAPGVALRCDWESVEELVGAALGRARRRGPVPQLRARVEPGLPLLWCDGLLLSQLLDNLVDNALKYSPEGAPVEILARRVGDQVLLAVRDRGPGVAPAWRERIFEVFHRGDTPAEGGGRRGAGVGLAVCRAIVRAHGSELRLRPRGHGGSSFECAWPVRPVPPPPDDAAAVSASAP